jgi:hypothetical protein
VLRCRIVLAAAEGESADAIAAQLEINRKTVMLWRARFEREGLAGMWEVAPGRGRKSIYGPDKIESIADATLRSKPKGMTHWSCRTMAEAQKVSKSTINNIWNSHNLKPHRTKTFQAIAGRQIPGEVDGRRGPVPESAPAGDRALRG